MEKMNDKMKLADASQRDFAKELRDEADSIYRNDNLDWLLKEAADEIDRLKAVALRVPEADDAETLNMRDAYDPTWGDDPSLAED